MEKDNEIGGEGGKALGKMLKFNTTLSRLQFSSLKPKWCKMNEILNKQQCDLW